MISLIMAEKSSEVLHISPNNIKKNPENPRMIFYEEDLSILKSSIKNNGILVSLTVYKKPTDNKYTILDGERRWKCSLDLRLKAVPANEIPPPSKRQNILLMFNIHKVHKDWELVPTALKLEILIRLLPKGTKTKEISTLTGMTTTRVTHCLRILKFDKKYLDLSIIKDPKRRIRGEFLAQLEEALEKLDKQDLKEIGYTRNQIIDIMIDKYHEKQFVNLIKEFRTLRKVLAARDKGIDRTHIHAQITEYLKSKPIVDKKTGHVKSKALSVDDLYERTSFNIDAEEQILKAAEKLENILFKFDLSQVKDKRKVKASLRKLKEVIEEILTV